MPAQHLVSAFVRELHLSPRVEANALEALAMMPEEMPQPEWAPRAAAAIMVGAKWAGVTCTPEQLADVSHVPETIVAKHYQALAERLRRIQG